MSTKLRPEADTNFIYTFSFAGQCGICQVTAAGNCIVLWFHFFYRALGIYNDHIQYQAVTRFFYAPDRGVDL